MRTAKNILMHELIGLECEVIDSRNKSQNRIRGKIIDETLRTIVIDGKRIFKKGTVFRVYAGGQKIDIEGDYLLSRPEDRIKRKVKKW